MEALPPVTPESVAAARDACLRERQRVLEATGILITDDGKILLPPKEFVVRPSVGK
jgi:hypothetical protein